MKILIIKTSSLGDILHTFSVINFLKKVCDDVQIDWVVEKEGKDLVERHPAIHQAIVLESKKWRKNIFNKETLAQFKDFKNILKKTSYDVVFDLQGNCKSALITLLSKSKIKVGFGRKSIPEWPNLFVTNRKFNPPLGLNIRESLLYIVENFFNKKIPLEQLNSELLLLNNDEISHFKTIIQTYFQPNYRQILVCPGSNWENKQVDLPTLEKLLNAFPQSMTQFLFIWGSEKEKLKVETLCKKFPLSHVLPRLSLPLLQHVMAKSSLVISMDSLPLHLAALTETPTWSIFGPSSANKYAPLHSRHLFYQGSCPYGIRFEKRCPQLRNCASGSCIKKIVPENLIDCFIKSEKNQ